MRGLIGMLWLPPVKLSQVNVTTSPLLSSVEVVVVIVECEGWEEDGDTDGVTDGSGDKEGDKGVGENEYADWDERRGSLIKEGGDWFVG
jgi:hypothetical protein